MSARPIQRVGHIGYDDNRFCGASVFGELAARGVDAVELTALAVGLPPLTAGDREVVRVMALCLTSPDARVWPLKMARVLAAYGNPFAGAFGAQLGNDSDRMGPGTASSAAASLAWISARVGDAPDDAALAAAVAAHADARGRIAGFGVPFRPEDERLRALHRLLADHPATRRPAWRLHLRVIEAVRARERLAPNIVFALAALLTDLGLAAHRAGMFVSLIMAPSFAAHAVEAADHDAALLRELPATALDDRSAAPRRTRAALARDAAGAGAGAVVMRRSLAW